MINRNTTMRLALSGNTLAPDSDEFDGYPDSRISGISVWDEEYIWR